MATIATDQALITLVNVFTVSPERQRQLADLLIEATESVMNRFPGYISANIHRSLDGSKVVNYAQWRRVEDFEAMLGNPAAQVHLAAAMQLAIGVEPHLYEVVFADHVTDPPTPAGAHVDVQNHA